MAKRPQWSEQRAAIIIAEHQNLAGALLPILHALQETFGYIDDNAIPLVSQALNLSKAEVHGVVSFYSDFRRTRPGRHIFKVCRGEACQAMGANDLLKSVQSRLSAAVGGTCDEDCFTLETVFCFGNCALPPSVMIDDQLYGRVRPDTIDALVHDLRGAQE